MKARGALVLLYLVIGVWFAWQNDYLSTTLLKPLGSVVLSVVLWFLIPLGVDLHLK